MLNTTTPSNISGLFKFACLSLLIPLCSATSVIQVNVPAAPSSQNVVYPNFLGISFELSFVNDYFGNDTSTIPATVINYLSALRLRTGAVPLRIRIGGNSMDSSVYVSTQTSPMVQHIQGALNANDQSVNYGPVLWDVLNKIAGEVGGANYLIGLSLLDPNNPNVPVEAAAVQETLGNNLDGFLLGNEPDLYTSHGDRPNIQNYTTDNYIDDFRTAASHLTNTSAGDILARPLLGGPTICCAWNLDALLTGGYSTAFDDVLKYISLQHYPQNNCFGSYQYEIPYYVQHPNVVNLSAWEQPGIDIVNANTSSRRPQLIMTEFNSASCGGIPGISNTFAVGSLWTVDYALQLASVGYSAAYIHTREQGISYNLFDPSPGSWTTNPPYYALLAVAEALQSKNGSKVVDLDIMGSRTDLNATVSGYAVYDAIDSSVQQFVLFNYYNATSTSAPSASFSLPSSSFKSGSSNAITVKYLTAVSMAETMNISWGGQTLRGVGDGKLVKAADSWAAANVQIDCTKGCTVNVPAPGMAVVFAGAAPVQNNATNTNTTTGAAKPSSDATSTVLALSIVPMAKSLVPLCAAALSFFFI